MNKKPGKSQSGNLRRPIVYQARRLRRVMSLPEILLWQRLKLRPQGLKFRKQHSLDPYIADFYCAAKRLVIEVDGIAHDGVDRSERDHERDEWMRSNGLSVLRINAAEILQDAVKAAQSIADYTASLPKPPR